MGAALRGDQRVDFVDDDGVYGAQRLRGLGGEQQVKGLGGGDEDFRRSLAEAGALLLAGVAGADADLGVVDGDTHAAGHVGDAGERGAEVAFDVDGEGFERGDVDDSAAWGFGWGLEHKAIQAPEEGGEGFAGAGGGEDEGAFAARDYRPALVLGRGGLFEDFAEPGSGYEVEAGEGIGRFRRRVGLARGHA